MFSFCENPALNNALNRTQQANDSKNLKKVYKWNSTVTCWKKIQDHKYILNSFLRMGFGWWLYFQKTNKQKNPPQNLKEADETNLNIMKCPLFHIHHFFSLEWTKHTFFNLIISNVQMKRNFPIVSNQREKKKK